MVSNFSNNAIPTRRPQTEDFACSSQPASVQFGGPDPIPDIYEIAKKWAIRTTAALAVAGGLAGAFFVGRASVTPEQPEVKPAQVQTQETPKK